jgi:hypothetical protein
MKNNLSLSIKKQLIVPQKKNSLFKTTYIIQNSLLQFLFKKQLIQNNLFYAKQLILCKTTYYNLLKKQLILYKITYHDLSPSISPSLLRLFFKQLQILSMEAMDFNGNTYNL